jgi:hypothetical protein
MKVDIRDFYSIEIEDALDMYWPDDVFNFGTWIRLYIGPAGDRLSNSFDLFVCTPEWLASNVKLKPNQAMWGRHMLIVSDYDPDKLKASAERLLLSLTGAEWLPIAEKIARYAAWEFEDYQE